MTDFSLYRISKPGEHLIANGVYTPKDLPAEFVYTEGDDDGRLDAFSIPIQLKTLEFDENLIYNAFRKVLSDYQASSLFEEFSYEIIKKGMDIDGSEFSILKDNYGNTLHISDMKAYSKEVLQDFKVVTLTKLTEQTVEVEVNELKMGKPFVTNKNEVQALVSVFLNNEFLEKWADDTILFIY